MHFWLRTGLLTFEFFFMLLTVNIPSSPFSANALNFIVSRDDHTPCKKDGFNIQRHIKIRRCWANPEPGSHAPVCEECHKTAKSNQKRLICDKCRDNSHAKCPKAEDELKKQYYNHTKSFWNIKYENGTAFFSLLSLVRCPTSYERSQNTSLHR